MGGAKQNATILRNHFAPRRKIIYSTYASLKNWGVKKGDFSHMNASSNIISLVDFSFFLVT